MSVVAKMPTMYLERIEREMTAMYPGPSCDGIRKGIRRRLVACEDEMQFQADAWATLGVAGPAVRKLLAEAGR